MKQFALPVAKRALILSDRQGFARRWFAPNLQAVLVPPQRDQVAACVTAALSTYGKAVKVTSGRHCYEDFVYNANTLAIIDMTALNQAGYDERRQAFFVDAGCECWGVYRLLLNGWGKTLSAGSCASVGMGGHIAGGGYGLLSRLHGLTIDHLSGVEIVTWDANSKQAQLRYVSGNSASAAERDLFWALCGAGGGNFGVIVRYYFDQLPDAPAYASIWHASWNWANISPAALAHLLAAYADLVQQMPESDFTLLKLNHVAAGKINLIMQMASRPDASFAGHCAHVASSIAKALACFAQLLPEHSVQHLTYLEALQTLNGCGPNQFGKYKSAYMNKPFPANQVVAIYHWLHSTPPGIDAADMQQSLLQVDSYGGAINRRAANETAVPQRSAIMKLQYQTYWNNAAEPGQNHLPAYQAQQHAHLEWIESFYRAVYAEYGGTPDPRHDPTGTVDGAYYNYPDVALGNHLDGKIDSALWLYFLDNYRNHARNLVQVKQQWDPENYFHHGQSIPVR